MSRKKGIAKATLAICEAGHYTAPSGATVDISAQQEAAVAGTQLFRPAQLTALLDAPPTTHGGPPRIEVTPEKTQVAAQRLAYEGAPGLLLLNFASARNPGGGFLGGATAQEEDVCRCSGLYPTLLTQPDYYATNRRHRSTLYTHHLIHSPGVPFFRVARSTLLERPFFASVITAPAPNAGAVLREDSDAGPAIDEALRRRAGYVLAVAQRTGAKTLVLGAWGCGVFMNEPAHVASAFGDWLESERFAGAFERVVFAVLTANKRDIGNIEAFRAQFGG